MCKTTTKRITTLILAVIFAFTAFSAFIVSAQSEVVAAIDYVTLGRAAWGVMWGVFMGLGLDQAADPDGEHTVLHLFNEIIENLDLAFFNPIVTDTKRILSNIDWDKVKENLSEYDHTGTTTEHYMIYIDLYSQRHLTTEMIEIFAHLQGYEDISVTRTEENYILRYTAEQENAVVFQGADGFLARYNVMNPSALSVNYISAAHGGVVANGNSISDVPNYYNSTRYVPFFVFEDELYIASNRSMSQIQADTKLHPDFPIMGFTFVKSIYAPTSGSYGGMVVEYMNPTSEVGHPSMGWADSQQTQFAVKSTPSTSGGYLFQTVKPSSFYQLENVTLFGQERLRLSFNDQGTNGAYTDFQILLPNNFIKMSTGEHVAWHKPYHDAGYGTNPFEKLVPPIQFMVSQPGADGTTIDNVVREAAGALTDNGKGQKQKLFPIPDIESKIQLAQEKGIITKDNPYIGYDGDTPAEVDGMSLAELERLLAGLNIVANDQLGVSRNILSTLRAMLTLLASMPSLIWQFFSTVLNGIWNTIIGIPGKIWELFKSALELISQFLQVIWDAVTKILRLLGDLVENLIEKLKDLFIFLFVPEEGFLDDKMNEMQGQLEEKLPIVPQLIEIVSGLFITLENEGSNASVNPAKNNNIQPYTEFIGPVYFEPQGPQMQKNFSVEGIYELLEFDKDLNVNNTVQTPNFSFTLYNYRYDIIDFSLFEQYRFYIQGFIIIISYFFFARRMIRKIPGLIGGFQQ